uniref:SCP domain-containing protein n=1 Tax=Jaculus jaculus TaxID=51337 RepID=A0A8C5LG28_JACJA
MALKNKFGCLWTLGLCLVATKSMNVPSYTDKKFIQETVDTHNKWRGKVDPPAANMKEMSWDKGLAKLAKSWSSKCKFAHNPCSGQRYGCYQDFDYVGENIWLGGLKQFSPKSAIDDWFNEYKYYDFDNLTCSQVCGHYTQVVWANSYTVGCAVTNCPNLGPTSTALFVCNYGPAGNYANRRPYTKGQSCSLCLEGERCIENLCGNGKLPQLTTYHLLSLCFILQRML